MLAWLLSLLPPVRYVRPLPSPAEVDGWIRFDRSPWGRSQSFGPLADAWFAEVE